MYVYEEKASKTAKMSLSMLKGYILSFTLLLELQVVPNRYEAPFTQFILNSIFK